MGILIMQLILMVLSNRKDGRKERSVKGRRSSVWDLKVILSWLTPQRKLESDLQMKSQVGDMFQWQQDRNISREEHLKKFQTKLLL